MVNSSPDGISVVICTYNGRSRISSAIESIRSQEGINTLNWELLVIDNCSTDNTYEYCVGYFQAHPLRANCRVIQEFKAGVGNARKRAIFEAKYEWILFVDDDNELFGNYMYSGWNILKSNSGIGALGGCGVGIFESSEPDWFSRYSLSFAVGAQASGNGVIRRSSKRKLYSAGTFFKKSIILFYFDSGFEPIMIERGEDNEWCMLIELSGYSLWYSHDLKFYHHIPTNRLNWNYLLSLKRSISLESAKLHSYTSFFCKRGINISIFLLSYFIEFVRLHALIIKHYLFRSANSPEIALGKVVIESKARSFRSDILISYNHFLQIKSYLKQINYHSSILS